jgi:hypothetical protein
VSNLRCFSDVPFSFFNCDFSITVNLNPLWVFPLMIGFVIFISLIQSKGRHSAGATSDLKLESDLQQAVAISKQSQWAPSWTAPKLPSSVIASIWTGRFVSAPTQPPTETERYASTLERLTFGYHRAAPYIVAAAFLSLRDAGLIQMFIEPRRKIIGSFQRVWIERTDLAFVGSDLAAVEGGLLLAVLDLAHRRFRKTTEPSAYSVVTEWIHTNQNHPFQWVVGVAVQQGHELGLYEPASRKRGLFGRRIKEKPVYSVEHLAACDEQARACAARWQQFELSERELALTLVTEVGFAIVGRQERAG